MDAILCVCCNPNHKSEVSSIPLLYNDPFGMNLTYH